jgi:hypothetical protein
MNNVALTLVACILVFSILLGSVAYFYSSVLDKVRADYAGYRNETEAELSRQALTIDNLTKTNDNLNKALNDSLRDLDYVRGQLNSSDNLNKILMTAINAGDADKLQTVVWHVSYKGDGSGFGNTDNFTDTYNDLKNGTAYNVLLTPELPRNLDWNAQLEWYKDNFTGIPLCVTLLEFNESSPIVNVTLAQLGQVVNVGDVRMVRIHELVAWCIGQNKSVPVEFVRSVLSFCRERGIGVFWNEWKNTGQVWQQVADCIAGYEDIVTVSYGTNNVFNEPVTGYMAVKDRFVHWGASVQAWYWADRHGGEPTDMPVSLLTWHALLAKNLGAEVLQFEPSWYFFDNDGQLNGRGEAFKVIVC